MLPPQLPPAAETADTLEVCIIGDVMMHSRQLSYDHTLFLEELAPILSDADIAVANAEFTLAGPPYTGYPAFSAPDSYKHSILDSGVDVLLTANNHILDKGAKGLQRTLRQYDCFTGSGLDEAQYNSLNPLILRRKGIKLALVNFTYGTNTPASSQYPRVSRMERGEIARQMKAAREKADFVLVLPHWGEEYSLRHNTSQQRWAEWLVEEGADAIVGAHPHVVQDTTHIGGVPVVYSVGNAVSNMSAPNTQLELAVRLRFVRHRITGRCEVLEPELRFLWCSLPGKHCGTYRTIVVDDWTGRRDEWLDPSDYDKMIHTLKRVKTETGIE